MSQCGFRDGQPLVCCRDMPATTPVAPPVTQPPPTAVNPLIPKPGVCGLEGGDRIYGGNQVSLIKYYCCEGF